MEAQPGTFTSMAAPTTPPPITAAIRLMAARLVTAGSRESGFNSLPWPIFSGFFFMANYLIFLIEKSDLIPDASQDLDGN
jgi:hypothetical protein